MSTSKISRRQKLLQAMDQEGRRLGFHSTMHNHACAALVGLHPTDWEVLDLLCLTEGSTAGELARQVGLSNGAMTGVLDRLEAAGWVERARDPSDRRRVVVKMFKQRDAEVDAAFTELNQAMNEANARFDDDQLALIVEFMTGASAALERSTRRVREANAARKAAKA